MPNIAYQEKVVKRKYPTQDDYQRKVCMRKAELLEIRAFRTLPLMATHGYLRARCLGEYMENLDYFFVTDFADLPFVKGIKKVKGTLTTLYLRITETQDCLTWFNTNMATESPYYPKSKVEKGLGQWRNSIHRLKWYKQSVMGVKAKRDGGRATD